MLQFYWRMVRVFKGNKFLNFNKFTKHLVLVAALLITAQTGSIAVEDVWGQMGLTDEAVQYNEDYTNTVFDKYNTNYTQTPTPKYEIENDSSISNQNSNSDVIEAEKQLIKNIEFYGLNSITEQELREQMQMKQGGSYTRDLLQTDLRTIYQMGYFTERMKAIPSKNADGTVTVKIVVEENIPVKDFTIEGNSVVSTEDILATLSSMKGKPQNIAQLNVAIAQIQELYTSKGYILARIDSVTDDPDGTINISIKEGIIDKIMIEGNEKTKDYVIARNILTEPGMIYNENLVKEDLVRLYATQAFKDVTREIEPSEEIPDAYDITIKIQEQRTASVSVGGGLDTVTGLFGSMGISENNFRGRCERLSLSGLAGTGVMLNDSSVKNHMNLQAELSYFKPYFLNADTSLNNRIFFRDFGSYQIPLAIERRIGAEATVAHRLKSNRHATASFSLGVENIDVKEGDFSGISRMYQKYNIPIAERAKQLEGGLFMSLSPALIYDTRDSGTVTRRGTMASLRFDENIGLDGFDRTNGKLTGMIKQYIPIGKKSSLSFTAKGGGAIHGDIPEVMAYRVGGPYTVRGFKMSGVGTGDAFIMGSAELATPIPFLDRTRIAFLNNIRFTMWNENVQTRMCRTNKFQNNRYGICL